MKQLTLADALRVMYVNGCIYRFFVFPNTLQQRSSKGDTPS